MSEYFSFRGKVYIGGRDESGNPGILKPVGNVPDMSLSLTFEEAEHYESMSGQDLKDDSYIKSKSGELSLTFDELLADNFAYILQGTATDITGSTVTDEAIVTAPATGGIYLLGKRNVSAVVLTHSSTTIDSSKYTVNAEAGSIEFTDVTGLTGAVTASYTYGASTEVKLFTATETKYWLRFEGVNKVNGDKVVLDLYKLTINPTDGMALISGDYGSAPLKAQVLADTLKTVDGAFGQFGRYVKIAA